MVATESLAVVVSLEARGNNGFKKRQETMASELEKFANRYAQAWCSQSPERVASFYTETGSLSVNDDAPSVGRAAITEVARGFMTAFPDMVVTMDRLVPKPHCVEFHWTLTGTNTGPEGTGNRVQISGCEEWQINADGLVAESKGYFDAAEYERQLAQGVDA